MHTPWGTATWGAAGGGLVVFLCGRERPTHNLEARDRDLGARDSISGPLALRLVSRTTGEAFAAIPDGVGEFGPEIAEKSAEISADAEARAALAGREACADEDADALHRRLVATGPWNLQSSELYLLRRGAAYDRRTRTRGSWRVDGRPPQLRVLVSLPRVTLTLIASCWRLTPEGGGQSADLVWRHPAQRCFPTCSETTHPITRAELASSPLARAAMASMWSWGGNREGITFAIADESADGLLRTPWGHGSWGLVPSRSDVLVAEFAQQRHMLQFTRTDGDTAQPAGPSTGNTTSIAFMSTRCKDGDPVRGVPIAPLRDAVHHGTKPANAPTVVDLAAWAFLPQSQ